MAGAPTPSQGVGWGGSIERFVFDFECITTLISGADRRFVWHCDNRSIVAGPYGHDYNAFMKSCTHFLHDAITVSSELVYFKRKNRNLILFTRLKDHVTGAVIEVKSSGRGAPWVAAARKGNRAIGGERI
jgi:hypothetical protein